MEESVMILYRSYISTERERIEIFGGHVTFAFHLSRVLVRHAVIPYGKKKMYELKSRMKNNRCTRNVICEYADKL